jgi:hypothetical protein
MGFDGLAESAPDSAPQENAPVQMAGHAGVMVPSQDGKIIKRVEKNEYTEFKRVMERQNEGDEGAASAFPQIFGVYDSLPQMAQRSTVSGNYNPAKYDPWAAMHKAGDYYVEMASVKADDPDARVLDFKVGNKTAVKRELMQNHGFSEEKAIKKEKKMDWRDDALTETGQYGVRDSDRTQDKFDAVLRFCKVFHHTLARMQAELAGQEYAEDSQLVRDVESIRNFFSASDTVYIASSIIMKYGSDRSQKNTMDRAKLIDLAHPVRKDEFSPEEFADIKKGMVAGIENVRRMMLGQPLVPVSQMGNVAEAAAETGRQRAGSVFENPEAFAMEGAEGGRARSDTVFEQPESMAIKKKKKWWQFWK